MTRPRASARQLAQPVGCYVACEASACSSVSQIAQPADTLIGVARLARPEFLIEVDAIAVK